MKPSLTRKILLTGLTVLSVLHFGPVIAQGSEQQLDQAYEQMLLDSLINYELLKPIHFTLSKKNELLNQDNLALKAENSMLRVQLHLQKEQYERMLADERKKRVKRLLAALGIGYALGKTTPPY